MNLKITIHCCFFFFFSIKRLDKSSNSDSALLILFFRSGKHVPGVVKIVSLPD